MACSSGCPTQNHESWGACVRAKSIQLEDVTAHAVNQRDRRDVREYVEARNEGMQPEGIGKKHVTFARKVTDMTGTPYRADK